MGLPRLLLVAGAALALLGAGCAGRPAPAVLIDSGLAEALAEARSAAAAFEALFGADAASLPPEVPPARFAEAQRAASRGARAAARADSLLDAYAARRPLSPAAAELRAALDIAPGLADDLLEADEEGPSTRPFNPRPLQAQFTAYGAHLRALSDRAAAEAAG